MTAVRSGRPSPRRHVSVRSDGKVLAAHDLRARSAANDALDWHPPVILSERDIRVGTIDFTDPRTHDLETYDAAHVNSLCSLPNGDVLVSLGIVWGRLTTLFRIKKVLMQAGVWNAFVSANKGVSKLFSLKSHAPRSVIQPEHVQQWCESKDGTRQLCASSRHCRRATVTEAATAIAYLNTAR
jgi:hypothetical protein